MKIKVGDKIYDGEDEPIMVILDDYDKDNIRRMKKNATKYCAFPDHMSIDDIEVWMDEV